MAKSTVVDVDLEEKKDIDDLEFKDIPHDNYTEDSTDVQTHTFTKFPPTAESEDEDTDKSELLKEDKKSASFWTFEYYQQFFDVETYQVLYRIGGSMLPLPRSNYLKSHIRPNPDLYGPFWICTTLVFTTAIAGNLANYLQSAGKDYQWKYDFHKVTFAATAIFTYWWLVPAAIFGVLWWRGSQAGYTFMEILCVYGYSLAIYIPVSILWVIQFNWFQWLLVAVGALLSGMVLVFTFWPAVREEDKKIAWTILVVIFLLHAALAVGFKLYFFHVPAPTNTSGLTTQKMQNVTRPPLLKHLDKASKTDISPGKGSKITEKDTDQLPKSQSSSTKDEQKQQPSDSSKKDTTSEKKREKQLKMRRKA